MIHFTLNSRLECRSRSSDCGPCFRVQRFRNACTIVIRTYIVIIASPLIMMCPHAIPYEADVGKLESQDENTIGPCTITARVRLLEVTAQS